MLRTLNHFVNSLTETEKMAFANNPVLKTPTILEQLLEEINFQRTKEMRQLLKDGKKTHMLRIFL